MSTRRDPSEDADPIDGALGDGSAFHEAYGYYAHGVASETVVAPLGWQDRLVRVEAPPHTAYKVRRRDGSGCP